MLNKQTPQALRNADFVAQNILMSSLQNFSFVKELRCPAFAFAAPASEVAVRFIGPSARQ